MTWLAMALSLTGNLLIIGKSRAGFGCWIVANVLWLIDAAERGDGAQGLLWLVYLGLALVGFARWGRREAAGARGVVEPHPAANGTRGAIHNPPPAEPTPTGAITPKSTRPLSRQNVMGN